ncbi:hypothetical protein D3C75_818830 [compost metagenome]
MNFHGVNGEIDEQGRRQDACKDAAVAGEERAEAGIIEIIADDEKGQKHKRPGDAQEPSVKPAVANQDGNPARCQHRMLQLEEGEQQHRQPPDDMPHKKPAEQVRHEEGMLDARNLERQDVQHRIQRLEDEILEGNGLQHFFSRLSGEGVTGKISGDKHKQRHMEGENPEEQRPHFLIPADQRFNDIAHKHTDNQ